MQQNLAGGEGGGEGVQGGDCVKKGLNVNLEISNSMSKTKI